MGADINVKDVYGNSVLIWTFTWRKMNSVRYLIEHGADLDITGEEGSTVLKIGSYAGRFEDVKYLIAKGANINARDNYGWTALMCASAKKELYFKNRQVPIIKFLISKGANVNVRSSVVYNFGQLVFPKNSTALSIAKQLKFWHRVAILQKAGAN
jgi:ankyrin repeat protein